MNDDETIAALFVQEDGVYSSHAGVDLWPESRDARKYKGPYPVVAHPPCQRWGKFWYGSPLSFPRLEKGNDGGCFKSALDSVRRYGGVLEHPAYTHAYPAFGIERPSGEGGWKRVDAWGGHVCHVEQGFYGHIARKATWLYAVGADALPDLLWGKGEQRLNAIAVERYGVKKAQRIGMLGMVGGGGSSKLRDATPVMFAHVLLSIARSVSRL